MTRFLRTNPEAKHIYNTSNRKNNRKNNIDNNHKLMPMGEICIG